MCKHQYCQYRSRKRKYRSIKMGQHLRYMSLERKVLQIKRCKPGGASRIRTLSMRTTRTLSNGTLTSHVKSNYLPNNNLQTASNEIKQRRKTTTYRKIRMQGSLQTSAKIRTNTCPFLLPLDQEGKPDQGEMRILELMSVQPDQGYRSIRTDLSRREK